MTLNEMYDKRIKEIMDNTDWGTIHSFMIHEYGEASPNIYGIKFIAHSLLRDIALTGKKEKSFENFTAKHGENGNLELNFRFLKNR